MHRPGWPGLATLLCWSVVVIVTPTYAGDVPGERAALEGHRLSQSRIVDGEITLRELREAGLRIFSTSFNKLDGYGDGPMNLADTVSPGGRPTLQGNGTLLRANGLDGQSCLECHSLVSAATVPPRLGIGGVGGSVTNAMIMPTAMDPADLDDLDAVAGFDGRFANPPFLFGSGGVELLALEMTHDLQALRARALADPGRVVPLVSKGVSFGSLTAGLDGTLDLSAVEGVDEDLIVRPFGRKGEFATIRDFDIGAMQFHFGMQPTEVVGEGIDADGDGVTDEILAGELSALHAFTVTLERPRRERGDAAAERGEAVFGSIGCASCHVAALDTRARDLPLRFPEDPLDPSAGVYATVRLDAPPTRFERTPSGGLRVPLYADLKRHDMGDALAEDFSAATPRQNREFTTARLWGVADTAPYLHDGRATTLTEAILAHGGEAQEARDGFARLDRSEREAVLTFLRSLRTPQAPARDLLVVDEKAGSR